ncbi:MAG: hypothetical protein AB2A00_07685 [Myxococcota bacterium]
MAKDTSQPPRKDEKAPGPAAKLWQDLLDALSQLLQPGPVPVRIPAPARARRLR